MSHQHQQVLKMTAFMFYVEFESVNWLFSIEIIQTILKTDSKCQMEKDAKNYHQSLKEKNHSYREKIQRVNVIFGYFFMFNVKESNGNG